MSVCGGQAAFVVVVAAIQGQDADDEGFPKGFRRAPQPGRAGRLPARAGYSRKAKEAVEDAYLVLQIL